MLGLVGVEVRVGLCVPRRLHDLSHNARQRYPEYQRIGLRTSTCSLDQVSIVKLFLQTNTILCCRTIHKARPYLHLRYMRAHLAVYARAVHAAGPHGENPLCVPHTVIDWARTHQTKMPRLYDAQRGFRLLQSAHTSTRVLCELPRESGNEASEAHRFLAD